MKQPHHIDILIGKNLRTFRNRRNISMAEFAKLLKSTSFKLTSQQIQKYEVGKNRVPASTLWKFAEILQVEITDFYQANPRK